MRSFDLIRPGERVSVLCIGAHADDIEIGGGGSILTWLAAGAQLDVRWCVASAADERETEARSSMTAMLARAQSSSLHLGGFKDSYLPYQGVAVKEWLENLRDFSPDIILTHRRDDAHQDHRLLSELTWNAFRDHLILEYEIPKWDGDVGQPNFYVPLKAEIMDRKVRLLHENFCSQVGHDWFDAETFKSVARLRGMECRAPERYAEAFWLRKAVSS